MTLHLIIEALLATLSLASTAVGLAVAVVAQNPAIPADPTLSIVGLVSQFGGLGFAVWFAYYTQTKTLPDIHTEHRKERAEWLAAFREELKAIRDERKSNS